MKKTNRIWIFSLILMGVWLLITLTNCKKENNLSTSIISTSDVSNIDIFTAVCGGNISSDGGSFVTERGVCWSENNNPTISDFKTTDGDGAGVFTSILTNLKPKKKYYVRAYSINQGGTSYGSIFSFTTLDGVVDLAGNIYHVVTIGTQTWMVENLKTTKYNDGTTIPNVTDATSWAAQSTGAYSEYNNTPNNGTTYGKLYNYYAIVNAHKLCPTGWHVPTDAEWTTLENYLIDNSFNYDGTNTENKYAKALASATGWTSDNSIGTVGNIDYPTNRNATGFTALPGGYRYVDGTFFDIGNVGFWWSSSEYDANNAWERDLFYFNSDVKRENYLKSYGFSVRCVRD
jgi:uncharacterized protein (TIGR02145 family)